MFPYPSLIQTDALEMNLLTVETKSVSSGGLCTLWDSNPCLAFLKIKYLYLFHTGGQALLQHMGKIYLFFCRLLKVLIEDTQRLTVGYQRKHPNPVWAKSTSWSNQVARKK
jgi:hypothetical protein